MQRVISRNTITRCTKVDSIRPAALLKSAAPHLGLFSERGRNQVTFQNYAKRTANTRTVNIAVQRLLPLVGQAGGLTRLRWRIANHVMLHRNR